MENKKNYLKSIGNLYQLLLWLLFYFVYHHAYLEEFNLEENVKTNAVYTVVFASYIAFSLFNIRYLMPILFSKKYKLYALWLVTGLIALAFLQNIFTVTILDVNFGGHKHNKIGGAGYFFFFGLIYVGLGSIFQFYKHWAKLREDMMMYEKEKINAELTALKAQINPHLLFNSLNNIYSLSLDKSDLTPDLILKLSDLMSYVLYDCKKDTVDIRQEIDFINNYVDLEKQRFEDNLDINYNLGSLDYNVEIAPLLFLPFIENAFKHVGRSDNGKPYINLSLTQDLTGSIVFEAVNSIFKDKEVEKSPYSGIGMQNINKRLAYLYPEQYELRIDQLDDTYSVYLKIEL